MVGSAGAQRLPLSRAESGRDRDSPRSARRVHVLLVDRDRLGHFQYWARPRNQGSAWKPAVQSCEFAGTANGATLDGKTIPHRVEHVNRASLQFPEPFVLAAGSVLKLSA